MDGSVDIRLIVTVGGILFSVVGAAAIARYQIKALIEKISDIEFRMRTLDRSTDMHEVEIQKNAQRLEVISGMLSPKEREVSARETAIMLTLIKKLEDDMGILKKMHNGTHPKMGGDL